jgi:hypothetical protein
MEENILHGVLDLSGKYSKERERCWVVWRGFTIGDSWEVGHVVKQCVDNIELTTTLRNLVTLGPSIFSQFASASACVTSHG